MYCSFGKYLLPHCADFPRFETFYYVYLKITFLPFLIILIILSESLCEETIKFTETDASFPNYTFLLRG